jgi:hypothetical protein
MAWLQAPIIIIGAGRSGSSLLNAILGAHPQIYMLGEMQFTVPALWHYFWNVTSAATARAQRMEVARCQFELESSSGFAESSRARIQPPADAEREGTSPITRLAIDWENAERERASAIIRHALDQLYRLSQCGKGYWGFKDIFLGSDDTYDWKSYDTVFPNAQYVHIIRNPFEFARSAADLLGIPFTSQVLHEHLEVWISYLLMNRARAQTGRYLSFTYEALIADPRSTLGPLLSRLDLDWDEACLSALRCRHAPSLRRSEFLPGTGGIITQIPDLGPLMAELGYQVPECCNSVECRETKADGIQIRQRTWRLNPPFVRDCAHGWVVGLESVPGLTRLQGLADDLRHYTRSPLRLLEDGVALGPAHSQHVAIRQQGGGLFSHWANGNYLLFSTSDNSDPNQNGRTYTLTFEIPS